MTWSNLEYKDLMEHYPKTPEIKGVDWDLTDYFHNSAIPNKTDQINHHAIHIVLVKGLMGDYMFNHFKDVKRHFTRLGYEVSVAPTSGSSAIIDNALAIVSHLKKITKKVYLLCHSKGGLDTLTALDSNKQIWPAIAGVILMQTPYGPSPVLASIFTGCYPRNKTTKLKELIYKSSINLVSAQSGCYDMIRPNINGFLKHYSFPFPVIQFASWSIRPTSWVDSFHKRLNQIDQDVAHDGQFFLHEMFWPCFPNILIGGIDHAQPVVGGYGFQPGRFWHQCLHTLKSVG